MLDAPSSSKLSGKTFKGKSLENRVFDNADIRGVNFSGADLRGASFKQAKAGITTFWFSLLVVLLMLLTGVASLIVAYATALVVVPRDVTAIQLLFETCLPLVITLFILFIIWRQGFGAALLFLSLFIAATVPIVAAVAQYEAGSATENIVSQVVGRSLGLTGMIAGIVMTGTIVASGLALGNRLLVMGLGVVAVPVAIAAIDEGIGDKVNGIDWPLAIVVTLLVFSLTIHVGHQAIEGDRKFRLLQVLAIRFATIKGTSFCGANLTDADFTAGKLKGADLRKSNLTRTRWHQVVQLGQAQTAGTYLDDPVIRQLVVTGHGPARNFDDYNLRGLNLQGANLADASFIGADLSNADLQDADLSRAKLAKTQIYNTRFNRACLTGANIQDWAIALDTQFYEVECDYVYMHLPTPDDQDPYRKPDNRDEVFKPGDFADFISPIIKTLDLYKQQNVDPRQVATTYKTIDLFHHEGIDPSAAAVALKRLAEQHPEAGIEVVALEGRGNEKVRLQARVSGQTNPSKLSKEYFEQYSEVKELAYRDLQALLQGIEEKDSRIRSLETMVTTAIQQKSFYVETYQNMGDAVTEKSSININAGGDIGSLSGIVGGNVSGVMNLGTISGNVSNAIGQLSDDSEDKSELKALLQELQAAIEAEPALEPDDKAEALGQVQTLAKAGQNPEDRAMQKAAKTAIKILKGTTAGLSETTKLVGECAKLLPAISGLLLLL